MWRRRLCNSDPLHALHQLAVARALTAPLLQINQAELAACKTLASREMTKRGILASSAAPERSSPSHNRPEGSLVFFFAVIKQTKSARGPTPLITIIKDRQNDYHVPSSLRDRNRAIARS